MMDLFLSVALLLLVLANAWVYSVARDAEGSADMIRLRMEGLQQRYNGMEYKLMMLEQRLSKKGKHK